VGDNPQELLKQLVEQLTAKKKHNPTALSIKVEFWRVFASSLERLMTDCWECSQGAEAIIYSELALPGYHIAEKLGVPGYAAYTQPLYRTHAFRHTQSNFQLNSTFNWLTHVFEEQFRWQFTRKNINRWRQETLTLFCHSKQRKIGSAGISVITYQVELFGNVSGSVVTSQYLRYPFLPKTISLINRIYWVPSLKIRLNFRHRFWRTLCPLGNQTP
jgi:hypothetical protein